MTEEGMIELAVPRDPDDEGAIEWIAERLTERQFDVLRRLAILRRHDRAYAADVGAPATLSSLWDFRRGERGIFAPLGLVSRDYLPPGERCNLWSITELGRLVLAAALRARHASQEGGG